MLLLLVVVGLVAALHFTPLRPWLVEAQSFSAPRDDAARESCENGAKNKFEVLPLFEGSLTQIIRHSEAIGRKSIPCGPNFFNAASGRDYFSTSRIAVFITDSLPGGVHAQSLRLRSLSVNERSMGMYPGPHSP